MPKLNRLFVAAGILSFALATYGNAGEGATSRVSSEPLQNRSVALAKTELVGFSETTDVDIWVAYGGTFDTINPQVTVYYANRGLHYSYSRDYVLVISWKDHLWIDLNNDTGVLAPNESGERSFLVPKKFIDKGAVVKVGLFGIDDDPSNDIHGLTLPRNTANRCH